MARSQIVVEAARPRDIPEIVAIDAAVTGVSKADYWSRLLAPERAGPRRRFFLVARDTERILGYVLGEIRDWEFGSPPCGWVVDINVRPNARLDGIGTCLLDAVVAAFRARGIKTIRTLLARDNLLVMSFFRSQGMMAAPFIALERSLDHDTA